MRFLAEFKNALRLLFITNLSLAAFAILSQGSADAQQLFIDFRFDANTGVNTTPLGATTATLAPGSAGQTFTVDIWATVVGDSSHTDITKLGLQGDGFRGASDVTASGGAFASGSTIGPVAAAFSAPNFGKGFAQPKVSDLGSTTPATAGNTDGTSITATPLDGILDFGGTTATQAFSNLSNSGGLILANNSGGANVGDASSPHGGWEWEVGQFKFTTGTTSSTAGATTLFIPTALRSGATTAATITQDGSTALSVPISIGTPLTFVVGGVVSGNDSILNMTPTTVTGNSLAGATTNLTVTNTAADNATATGAFTGTLSAGSAGASAVITGSPVGAAPGNVAITYGAPSATLANFTYTITNGSNASDSQTAGNKTTTFTVNVGSAIADNTGVATAFGTALTGTVLHNGSYLGLESKVLTDPVAGAGKPAFPTAASGSSAYTAGTADLAVILAGNNTLANNAGTATVSMAWRTRTAQEAIGGSAVYSPSLAHPTTGLVSDIVNLQGLTPGAEAAGGATDPYVLEMAFNPALTPAGSGNPAKSLATLIANRLIYMVSLNSSGLWDRATIDENFNNKVGMTDPSYGVHESFSQYLSSNPSLFPAGSNTPATVTAAELNNVMGAWGVDTTSTPGVDMVWSVVNHNSQFAVVPEPSTLLLAGLGLLGLVGLRRRMKKTA